MTSQAELKQTLVSKKEQILTRIENLKKDKQRTGGALEADFAEQATSSENDQVVDALDEASRQELTQIENALEKMNNGTYGTCADCQGKIEESRLKALPTAVFCLECQEENTH